MIGALRMATIIAEALPAAIQREANRKGITLTEAEARDAIISNVDSPKVQEYIRLGLEVFAGQQG